MGYPLPRVSIPGRCASIPRWRTSGAFAAGPSSPVNWCSPRRPAWPRGRALGGPNTAVDPADVVVGYGSIDRTKTTKIPAAKVFVHQGYLSKGLDGKADVALIKLARPIASPDAVALADPETDKKFLTPGAKVTVTGWGALWSPFDKDVEALIPDLGPQQEMMDKWQFPRELREVEIDSMDNDTCNATFQSARLSVAQSEICAMIKGSTKDSCQGDSGGPLVVAADVPRGFLQVGVVSWGTMCGNRVTPSVFARVSSFSDWINETMQTN